MKNRFSLKNVILNGKKTELSVSDGKFISDFDDTVKNIIDGRKLHLFPGIIDVHTHIRDMDLNHKETWDSASKAAAAGGITTIFDMPNTKPATYNQESLNLKRKAARNSIVNYGFNFGITDYNHEDAKKANP